MLQKTWEHETLHKCLACTVLIIWQILFWEIQKPLTFFPSGLPKLAFLGVWWRYILSALICHGSLLQISQNKIIVEYKWVPSSTKQKQTPATAARTPPWHHHRHFYTMPHSRSWDKIQQWMKAILDYPKLAVSCQIMCAAFYLLGCRLCGKCAKQAIVGGLGACMCMHNQPLLSESNASIVHARKLL